MRVGRISGRTRGTILLLLGALAAIVAFLWLGIERDPDRALIAAERSRRLAIAKRQETLPGTPDLAALPGRLSVNGLTLGAPVFIRIFKREFELELWMKRDDRYHRFAVYPICRWSGLLGPKLKEGDAQAPEGFYTIDKRSLNPDSRWHRSFNLGFPNAHDRAHGRTGSFLMVHGGCSSVGCYAMTNGVIDELWRLVETALRKGQPRIHVHVFPFRLSEDNLAARRTSPWAGFWSDLKPGYDAFEATQLPPRVSVCDGRYRIAQADDERGSAGAVEVRCEEGPRVQRPPAGKT